MILVCNLSKYNCMLCTKHQTNINLSIGYKHPIYRLSSLHRSIRYNSICCIHLHSRGLKSQTQITLRTSGINDTNDRILVAAPSSRATISIMSHLGMFLAHAFTIPEHKSVFMSRSRSIVKKNIELGVLGETGIALNLFRYSVNVARLKGFRNSISRLVISRGCAAS